jgi:hypothetical protein
MFICTTYIFFLHILFTALFGEAINYYKWILVGYFNLLYWMNILCVFGVTCATCCVAPAKPMKGSSSGFLRQQLWSMWSHNTGSSKCFSILFYFNFKKVFLWFYLRWKTLFTNCEKFKNIILFIDYIKFYPQTFHYYIYIYIYSFEYLFFNFLSYNLLFILILVFIFIIVICFSLILF